MFSVLAIGPMVSQVQTWPRRWVFKVYKILSTPYFGEVNPSTSCHKFFFSFFTADFFTFSMNAVAAVSRVVAGIKE